MLSYTNDKYRLTWQKVAVPVNYGMLSYIKLSEKLPVTTRRSPRQLWNALLREFYIKKHKRDPSQSPSIMECSPTKKATALLCRKKVAVPVNYGMLSYKVFYL